MAKSQTEVREWLAKNQKEMICCPSQPGNLMISKSACFKRYWMGRNEDYQDLMKGDVFNYAHKRGLSLCRECPIGKELALASKVGKSYSGPQARNVRSNQGWKMPA